MNAYDAWESASAGWREDLAAFLRRSEAREHAAPPRATKAKRREVRRDVPSSALAEKMADIVVRRMSPAGKAALREILEEYGRVRRAERAERKLMRSLMRSAPSRDLEHKTIECSRLEIKSAGGVDVATFYAAVWNNVDLQNDMIIPGAVKNMDQFIRLGWFAPNHDNDGEPIGYVVDAAQDGYGLKVADGLAWHAQGAGLEADRPGAAGGGEGGRGFRGLPDQRLPRGTGRREDGEGADRPVGLRGVARAAAGQSIGDIHLGLTAGGPS